MYKGCFKRIIDLLLSILALPIFLIILLIIGPIIYLQDKGPIFYNAPRLGQGGKIFKMYKFRSMKINAPDIRNEDGSTYNSGDDPRLTRIGKVIRKTSLDETPQLINVIIGDMSLVGPRPDLPDAINLYYDDDIQKLKVKPGITGYSQAYSRNNSSLKDKFRGDVHYVNNISFFLDIKILLKTIKTVFMRENIYKDLSQFKERGK